MKKTNKLLVLMLSLSLLISSCLVGQSSNDIDLAQFKTKISSEKYVLVDVRKESEFAEGHIEGAINIDYYSATFSDDISALGLDIPVLVYCRSGNRSGKSMKIMNDLGFEEVYNLKGGFKGWVSEKNTITKD